MIPPTYDERARTLTKSLLAEAERIPRRRLDERTKTAPWTAIAVFLAMVVVIGSAVAVVSIELQRATVAKSPAASQAERWNSFALGGVVGGLSGVGCFDSVFCIAVDHGGHLWISTNPEGGPAAWKLFQSHTAAGKAVPYLPAGTTVVSCASDPMRCEAVVQDGYHATTPGYERGPVARWSGTFGGIEMSQVKDRAVSCDEVLCVAVGGFTGSDPGLPSSDQSGYVMTYTEPIHFEDSTVSAILLPDASALTAVSCPSPSYCVATDASGDVLTSTDPRGSASAWSIARAVVPAVNSFTGLSCPSVTFCVAVTHDGDVVTSADPSGGARAWQLTRLDGSTSLDGVSCASTGFCIAGGPADSVFVSHHPAGGSSAWSRTRMAAHGAEAMVAVSCPSTAFCVAVDGGDGVHVYANPSR
jgi:hypothetical protein